MKNILVTGANGFVGHHLSKELADNGYTVHGIGGSSGPTPEHLISYETIDLSDAEAVQKVDLTNIDGIIHLAGLAAVGPSFNAPMHYINTNVGIELNLFERALEQQVTPRFIIVSSGSLYDPTSALPINETSPVNPSSPYAVSKLGQENLAHYYGQRGFECIIARPFNHIGPGQGPGFLVPDMCQQFVAAEQGRQSTIMVGNLESERDYTDVRDIARAYRLLLEFGKDGVTYNICSGTPISGQKILEGLRAASNSQTPTSQDPSRMRPADNPVIYGSHIKLTTDTGWEPAIDLETTLRDVVAYWRAAA